MHPLIPNSRLNRTLAEIGQVWRLPHLLNEAKLFTARDLQSALKKIGVQWSLTRCWRVKTGFISRIGIDELVAICALLNIELSALIRIDAEGSEPSPASTKITTQSNVKTGVKGCYKKFGSGQRPVEFRVTPIASRKLSPPNPSNVQNKKNKK